MSDAAVENEYRIEHDTMGEVRVPKNALWRAQTQRAVENFPISGRGLERTQIRALGLLKGACAQVNKDLGLLAPEKADAIIAAAAEIADGRHDDQFPIDVFQTGSGTSSNMNTNEVIASIAAANGVTVHPNDDVNMSQSSNDTFPTPTHIPATAAGGTGDRRHRGGYRPQRSRRFRRQGGRGADRENRSERIAHCSKLFRGPGRPRWIGGGVRCAAHHRGVTDQDRQRHSLDGFGPADGLGRNPAAGPAAGQLDHAGQGESGSARSRYTGRRAGDWQRRRGCLGRCERRLRTQCLHSDDGPQHPGVLQAADQCVKTVRGALHHRAVGQRRTPARAGRIVTVDCDAVELGHRLRGGSGGGQASTQGAQDHPPDRHRPRPDRREIVDRRAGPPPRRAGDGQGEAGRLGHTGCGNAVAWLPPQVAGASEVGSTMTAPPGGPYGTNPYGQDPYWGGQPQGNPYPYQQGSPYPSPPPGQYANPYPPQQYPQAGQQIPPGWPGGPYPPGPPPKGPGSKAPWLIIAGLAVLAVIALVVTLIVVFSGNGNKSTKSNPSGPSVTTGAPTSQPNGSGQTASDCTPNVSGGDKPAGGAPVSAGTLWLPASAAPGWTPFS